MADVPLMIDSLSSLAAKAPHLGAGAVELLLATSSKLHVTGFSTIHDRG